MIGGAKGIGIGIDFGIPNQYCRATNKPYIEKDVLDSLRVVASAYGKTNNYSDRAIVKNLVDPDNPFVISNAAYTEGSGYADKGSPYYGAFVTDGIDDLITSTKTVQEMLGESNEITVVSMIHQVKDSSNNVSFTNYIRGSANGYFRNIVNNYDKTGIYGYTSSDLMGLSVVNNILGDKNDYTSNGDNRDSIINGNFSVQGYSYNDGNNTGDFSSVAWYWTIIANKVLTTDQINQVIAYFNLDRTLKSDIYCNIAKQGITNENHAEFGDKLIDFSGNGRDIQLNNIAWKGDSGIGKYEVDFLDSSIWNSSNSTITSSKIDCKNSISHIMLLYYNVGSKEYPDIPSFKVIKTGADIDYSYIDETGSPKSVKIVDGVNVLPASHNTLYSGSGRFCGFGNPGMGNSVTITQIPSHAGALCLDGVNDFGQFVGDLELKDYTFIADRAYSRIAPSQVPFIASTQTNGQAPFLMEYLNEDTYVYPHSFGTTTKTTNLNIQRQISYQSTYVYNGNSISKGTSVDTGDGLTIGNSGSTGEQYSPLCLWSLMLFPYSMSEFLIERQLKKHKLGTLYPNMVEFRPIIPEDENITRIDYFVPTPDKWIIIKPGDYVDVGARIVLNVYTKFPYKVEKVSSLAFTGMSVEPSTRLNIFDVKGYIKDKTPQKIKLTLAINEDIVQWNPAITSNLLDSFTVSSWYLNGWDNTLTAGTWIKKTDRVFFKATFKTELYGLETATFGGTECVVSKADNWSDSKNIWDIRMLGTVGDLSQVFNLDVYELIRFEDIVQPYPAFYEFTDENRNLVTWGSKIKVGSTITRIKAFANSNLLKDLYNISYPKLNGVASAGSKYVVERQMVFTCTATWTFDNNEPKCILSPRLLSIPNSSYKILGYIPDISGHGNNGVIHNSAYAEGSGVNEDGSYQFDGVDDFVTIPTLSSGSKQMLMKVNWNSLNHVLYDQRNNAEAPFCIVTASGTIAYNQRNVGGNTYIDGILNNHILVDDLQAITHNIVLNNDYNVANSNSFIGTNYTKSLYAQMALYDFMLFDDISTDEEILNLNKYIGIEPKVELPPYYWDTYGKTNFDADKATIQQRGVAIGDYDLTNYNHTYEGMSGYNGYPVVFGANKTWANESNGYVTSITSNTIHITNVLNAGLSLLYSYVKYNGNLQNIKEIPPFKIEIKGLEGRSKFIYKYLATSDATKETNLYLENGTHELPKSFLPTEALINNAVVGFSISPIEEGVTNFLSDITIKVLPEYENGLVYDGVEDYSVNTNIPALTDYTYVIKRENLNNNVNSATMYKGNKDGGGAFIVDYIASNGSQQYSYGNPTLLPLNENTIIYGTKTSYNGSALTVGSNTDENGLGIGHWSSNYKSIVLYKLVLYPKTIPLLQINFLKNLMEKDEIIDLTNPIFIQ